MKSQPQLIGTKFGRWTVENFSGTDDNYMRHWWCRCDCGVQRIVKEQRLTGGTSQSCGCLARAKVTKHGLSTSGIYRRWWAMMNRCYLSTSRSFHRYGGRGIKVCERWHDFESFLADMGLPPNPAAQLERTNNNGNYEPGNCIWATAKEQQRNRSTNRHVVFSGKSITVAEAAEISGVKYFTLLRRLNQGLTAHDAMTRPLR